MANTYKNIVITPNISSNTADPKVVYSGGNTTANTDITLYVYPDSNGSLSWEGSAGQLFSITNDLSNNIFSVNDVSGIPYLEVYANGFVSVAPFGGNVTIGNTAELILSPGTGLYANGSFGSAGQVLHSNGSAVYWAADDNSGTVTSVGTGNGLTGGAITTTGTVSVLANSGITANTTGLFVTQGTGTVVNATGVHVNATYIGTLSANNASFLGGTAAASYQLNSTLNANIASYLPTYTGVVNGSSHTVSTSFIANATGVYHTGTMNAASHTVGTSTIANSTGVYTGVVNGSSHTAGATGAGTGGTIANVTTIFVGNNTINSVLTSAGLNVNGATVVNSSVVNAAAHTISTTFIANTTGVYHTGTMNAASHTVGTSTIANATGVYTGVVNAASHTVGSNFIANSTFGVQVQSGASTANTVRNAGITFWTDRGFGAELHYGDTGSLQSTAWATALYGRKSDTVAVRIGAYPASNTSQNTFSEYITVLNSGNVGIGNTSPAVKLQVAGNMGVDAFIEFSNNITSNYTITTGKNAMSAGPITVNTSVTVTVPTGSTWTIV